MNTIILMGRLTQDPELRYTQGANATAVCNITLAVRKSYVREGEPDANFIDAVAFGGTAEFIEKYFSKGQPILIRGELNIEIWKDKDDNTRRTARVTIDKVDFAGDKPQDKPQETKGNSSKKSGYRR